MTTATQEFVSTRLYPIERTVEDLKEKVAELQTQVAARDADLLTAERRVEEVVKMLEK